MRPDLTRLTPEVLAAATNLGLVKRAQREIAAGNGPSVEILADQTVRAVSPDGAITELAPGIVWTEARCSCGANAVCRHRVALVLTCPREPVRTMRRSPDSIPDADLVGYDVAGATRLRSAGITVDLHVDPPVARLPTCAVRFLLDADLAGARCDCAAERCAHVVIAVWAFRAAGAKGPIVAGRISLGPLFEGEAVLSDGPDPVTELLGQVLEAGVSGVVPWDRWFAHARPAGQPWMTGALDVLEDQLRAWAARDARHHPSIVRSCVAELAARRRAVVAGAIPARDALGTGERAETTLRQGRWVALGARVLPNETAIYLSDAETGVVSVHLSEANGDPTTTLAPGVTLGALATGNLVARRVVRTAEGRLSLAAGRHASILPGADWATLPGAVRWNDADALAEWLAARPPRILRPRVRADDVFVLFGAASQIRYNAGEQVLRADWTAGSTRVQVVRRFEGVAPGAIDALARALPDAIALSGEVRLTPAGLRIDPIALWTDRVLVPDLGTTPRTVIAPDLWYDPSEPVAHALSLAGAALDASAHLGLARLDAQALSRLATAAAALDSVGVMHIADALRSLGVAIQLRLAGQSSEVARRWLDAAIYLELAG